MLFTKKRSGQKEPPPGGAFHIANAKQHLENLLIAPPKSQPNHQVSHYAVVRKTGAEISQSMNTGS